ncbi:MAG: hypothetical protein QXN01_04660, partial [Candidatus Anstonellales archaeon]
MVPIFIIPLTVSAAEIIYQDNFEDGNYDKIDSRLQNGMSWAIVEGNAVITTGVLNGSSLGL